MKAKNFATFVHIQQYFAQPYLNNVQLMESILLMDNGVY